MDRIEINNKIKMNPMDTSFNRYFKKYHINALDDLQKYLQPLEPIEKYREEFYEYYFQEFNNLFLKLKIHLQNKISEKEAQFKHIYTLCNIPPIEFNNIYFQEKFLRVHLFKKKITDIFLLRREKYLQLKYEELKKKLNISVDDKGNNIIEKISYLESIDAKNRRKKNILLKKIFQNFAFCEFYRKNKKIFLYFAKEIESQKITDIEICRKIFSLPLKELENLCKNIFELKILKNKIVKFFIEKNTRYESLFNKTSMKLGFKYTEELQALYDTYIIYKMKYESMFDELFDITREEYFSICQIFTIECEEKIEKSHKSFMQMESTINKLLPRKEKFLEILKIISEREILKEKIIIFEKSASDPNRLFRSSVHLLEEERFRKSAFPMLINIENRIFKLIYLYEQEYGEKFLVEGKEYKVRLKKEMDERVLNRNFFNNKKRRK